MIKINPVDDVPPFLVAGTSLQMRVHENKLENFNRRILRYCQDCQVSTGVNRYKKGELGLEPGET